MMNELYPKSLNTIRIMTIYLNGKYEIVSSVFRLGNNGTHVDNFSISGIAIGVNSDGSLKEIGVDKKLYKYYRHPETKVLFKNIKLPNFEKAIQLVQELHSQTYYFNLASWDLAINKDGEYVFIEVNLGAQGINIHQLTNGPLFGSRTEEVLNSVFK